MFRFLSCFCLYFYFFFNATATTEIYTLSLHDALPIFRQQRDHGVEMLGVGLEPDAQPAHDGDDRVVERRLHAQLAAVLAHGAVQIVDLGAPATHDVLKQRRTAAAALPGDVGDVDEQLLQSPSLIRVDEALRGNAVDRLHLVTDGAAHHDALGTEVHADGGDLGIDPHLGRAQAGKARQRIGHAVDGQLGPALTEEVGRHVGLGHRVHHRGQLLRAVGDAAVVLADLEADGAGVGALGVARLVHAAAGRVPAARRALLAGNTG